MRKLAIFKGIPFEIIGRKVDREYIHSVIPNDFKARDFLVAFYLEYNGLYFTEGAQFIENKEVDSDCGIEIELFYRIENKLPEIWEATKEISPKARLFAERNFPIGRDSSGNEFWVDMFDGSVKYIEWEYDFTKESVSVISSDFKEFCMSIERL